MNNVTTITAMTTTIMITTVEAVTTTMTMDMALSPQSSSPSSPS